MKPKTLVDLEFEEYERNRDKRMLKGCVWGVIITLPLWVSLIFLMGSCDPAFGAEIDMKIICQIESNCDPSAKRVTKTDQSYGKFQVSPICLKDYLNFHPKENYTVADLMDEEVNTKIAYWYMNERLPKLLRHFKLEDTWQNRIISWNAGINYLVKNKPIPTTTRRYIEKYERLSR